MAALSLVEGGDHKDGVISFDLVAVKDRLISTRALSGLADNT